MMDSNNKNFFVPHSSKDPSKEEPVSPYLNFNPAYIAQASDYILPEGSKPHRGHMEMAFTNIGASILFGAGVGGFIGATSGFKEIKSSGLNAGKGNQLFNLVKKQGGEFAQKAGVIVLTYSGLEIAISGFSDKQEVNTVLSGALTGLIYTIQGPNKHRWIGGVAGLAVGSILCLFQNKDRIKSFLSR